MLNPFKFTRKHLTEYDELPSQDIGLYAIKVRDEQPLLVYETEHIARKAFEYFAKIVKGE